MILFTSLLSLILFLPGLRAQQILSGRHCIEPGKGQFLILVGSSGLFSMFGHDHTIEAKEITGCAEVDGRDLTRSSIELTFPASKITVLDPKDKAADRAKVQQQMDTDVLRPQEFPSIRFRSTGVRRARSKENGFIVDGQLTIRERTQPVAIPLDVAPTGDGSTQVKGEYSFRQTAFGITPVRVAGGTVRVKDEITVRFELYLK
jgi:polyisoprenoid-binding protein YceI